MTHFGVGQTMTPLCGVSPIAAGHTTTNRVSDITCTMCIAMRRPGPRPCEKHAHCWVEDQEHVSPKADLGKSDLRASDIYGPKSREARIAFLEKSRPLLIEYCRQKLEAEDWHGCQDAGSDLRDLDCELDGLRY